MKLLVVCLLILAVTGALGQKYYGVNEAALGWGASAIPGVAGTNFPLISNASLDYFAAKGMNTIRVSITWERLQPTLYGSFDPTYVGYITNSVNYITNVKGMYCLLDLHNYHRYRDNVIGSSAVPYAALTDVWQKLATLYKSNARMLWGTMNEPYGVGYLAAQLGANAAIKGIRDAGATQLITISGNDYSAVYSWVGTNSLYMGPANITNPLNNYHYELHIPSDMAMMTPVTPDIAMITTVPPVVPMIMTIPPGTVAMLTITPGRALAMMTVATSPNQINNPPKTQLCHF